MNTDKHLRFIVNKIVDINVALFHCETNSVLKIPTTIINTYSVDEDGSIYFFIPHPKQLLCEFEKQFPVALNYFKKGVTHYMNIHGFARIINDPEELHCYNLSTSEIEQALTRDVLVKVKILKADYYDSNPKTKSLYTRLKSLVYNLLEWVEPKGKSFDFSPKHQPIPSFGF